MLKELEYDKTARVSNTLIHVIGQIAYKKGCLETVVEHLKTWGNKMVVRQALNEIISVHGRYKNFSVYTQVEATEYINSHINEKKESIYKALLFFSNNLFISRLLFFP